MKIFTISFIAFILCCFQNDSATKEIIEKVNRIRAELLSDKPLPTRIVEPQGKESVLLPSAGKIYNFYYHSIRRENNLDDSVLITITLYMDSLEHLSFNELNLQNDKMYMYKVNKYGVIDWAYKSDDSQTMKSQDIEINTDSSNYIPKFQPIKNPDEKTRTFYNDRLKTSLDELEKILFTK